MTLKNKYAALEAAIGMLMLILDGRTALEGAQAGIGLCIRTVIPALFPFFVLSPLLLSGMDARWLRPLGRLCKMPEGTEALLAVGFLGGYPTGAQCVAQAYRNGQVTKAQAQRMLAFCSNAGPSFLFGMVARMFGQPVYAWLLWGIHIAGALMTALLMPAGDLAPAAVTQRPIRLPQALKQAVFTMALVCGWVVFFRTGIAFLNRWILWLLPESTQALVWGILELSNGCCALTAIPGTALRFIICSGLLGFGGICVTMQTRSVTEGLSLKPYVYGKLLQAGFSLILAYGIQFFFDDPLTGFPYFLIALLPIGLLVGKRENNSSIPQSIGV